MRQRVLFYVSLAALAACQGTDRTGQSNSQPSYIISDGSHTGLDNDPNANPDFFFLRPMVVNNPKISPNWDRGAFNRDLTPFVQVCPLDLPAGASEDLVLLTTPCKAGSPFTILFKSGKRARGDNVVRLHAPTDRDADDDEDDHNDDGWHYHAKWKVPGNAGDAYFRIMVLVGDKRLGFADVHAVNDGKDLKKVDTDEFVARKDGQTVQIKFRIEKFALCSPPGPVSQGGGACASSSINLADGGAVSFTPPGDPAGTPPSGVTIPSQTNPPPDEVTVTVQPCPSLRDPSRSPPLDLPVFGACLRITTIPALTAPLDNPATVFVCDFQPDVAGAGLSEAQEKRVSLHRRDETPTPTVAALPHAPGCLAPSSSAAVQWSLKGLLADLIHGRLKRATQRVVAAVAPTPLYARRRIDQGGGGESSSFSDFQFALPCKLEIVSGNNQGAAPGAALALPATVKCTDIGNEPVPGATVHFAPAAGNGSANQVTVTTGPGGQAQTIWTLGSAAGTQSMKAQGFGLAGSDFNGPRCGLDPFQAIQASPPHPSEFDSNGECGSYETPVLLLTGSQTFTAFTASPLPVPYGSAGWSYQIDGTDPTGWFSSVNSPFSLTGTGGFGEDHNGCGLIVNNTSTSWPAGITTLRARRSFALTAAGTVTIGIAIDNDVQVFLDGVDISSTNLQAQTPVGGLLIHDGCPTQGSFTFHPTLAAGVHLIAIRAVDRGGSSYFDASITTP